MSNVKRGGITLDDIARETGLSKFSVSRAVSGKNGVSEQTRKRVLEACDRLGYERKASKNSTKKYVLLILPRHDSQDNSFWMKVIVGIENGLTRQGYSLHLKVVSDKEDEMTSVEAQEAAGILFVGYKSLPYVDKLAVYNKPMLILTYPPYNLFPYDTMHFADREGACALCEYLINNGHKRIGFFGSLERPSMKCRFNGILETVNRMGAELTHVWDMESYLNSFEMIEELKRMKEDNTLPSAIVCSTDKYAQSLLFMLNSIGLTVPQEVSVTGFNSDFDEAQSIPLTSIGYSRRKYGIQVADNLLAKINNPGRAVVSMSVIPKLVIGATTKSIL